MRMFNIPNLITAANMLCGVFAIILAFGGRIDIAPYFVFLGAIFDFFDGFLARLLKQQGELGKQLDSFADMITFGLAPGVIMMVVLIFTAGSDGSSWMQSPERMSGIMEGSTIFMSMTVNNWLGSFYHLGFGSLIPFFALIIPFFSMFRLAKFNIDTRQSESFIGLPTPANTIFFMAFPLLLTQYADTHGWQHDLIMWLVQPIVLIPLIIIMSLLLVAEIPLFALKFKSLKWKGNELRYSFLISSGIMLLLLQFWAIPLVIVFYLLLSVVNNYVSKG